MCTKISFFPGILNAKFYMSIGTGISFLVFLTITLVPSPLEKGKATHSSILAWRIPWTVLGPWGPKELDRLSDLDFHFDWFLVPRAHVLPAWGTHSPLSSSRGLEESKHYLSAYSSPGCMDSKWVLLMPSQSLLLRSLFEAKNLPIGAYFEYSVLIYTQIIILWFHLVKQWLSAPFSPPCFGSTLLLSGFINPKGKISHRTCFFTPCE